MPRIIELRTPDGKDCYKICSMYEDTIEKEIPSLWFGAYSFFELTQMQGYPIDEAKEMIIKRLRAYATMSCPDFMLALFDASNKKEQERLLRGKAVTPDDMICWIIQSGRYDGLFCQYSYDSGAPDELKGRTPIMIDASDPKNIKAIGKTDLSSGALMHLVESQKKVIAQFIDLKDGRWYCFFRTHRGLAGREPGNQGQHFHFISSAYGVNRDLLVEGFKKGVCPTTGYHLRLIGYGEE